MKIKLNDYFLDLGHLPPFLCLGTVHNYGRRDFMFR